MGGAECPPLERTADRSLERGAANGSTGGVICAKLRSAALALEEWPEGSVGGVTGIGCSHGHLRCGWRRCSSRVIALAPGTAVAGAMGAYREPVSCCAASAAAMSWRLAPGGSGRGGAATLAAGSSSRGRMGRDEVEARIGSLAAARFVALPLVFLFFVRPCACFR